MSQVQIQSGVYMILNTVTGDRYIGSSKNIVKRIRFQKWAMKSLHSRHVNKLLLSAVKQYGMEVFVFSVIELVADTNRLLERESFYQSTLQPEYNRITEGVVREFSDDLRLDYQQVSLNRYKSSIEREKLSNALKRSWANKSVEQKNEITQRLKIAKQKFTFHQYDLSNNFICSWESVEQIILANPTYKWQNIYAACNGSKPTYKGFMWAKELKI